MSSSTILRSIPTLLALVPMALFACGGDGDNNTSSTTQATTALESAQCTFKRGRGTEDTCFKTYLTCNGAAGADGAACRAALQDCLPKPPAVASSSTSTTIDTNDHGGKGGGRGGGDDRGGGRGDGDRTPRPTPDPAVVATCRTALDSCLASLKGDQTPCFSAHNKCVDEAFRAAFQAECDASTTRCANVDAEDTAKVASCDALKKRCAEGIGGRFAKDAGPCP